MKLCPELLCAAALVLLSLGCDKSIVPSDDAFVAGPAPEITAPAPVLAKLTQEQYRNTIAELFGATVVVPGGLEPDTESDGLYAVGSTLASVSPLGAERYSDAAYSIAQQVVADPELRSKVTTCEPKDGEISGCLEEVASKTGATIWRRPLEADEVASLAALGADAVKALGEFDDGLETILAALLQSPNFLYRVTQGEVVDGARRYTSWEVASKLSYFLWNTMPDAELFAAAGANELVEDEELAAQVDRMLADPKARQGVRNFFAEWLDLFKLDDLKKDPNIFKHYAPELGAMAREETLRVAEHLVFDQDADMRDFMTTRTTFASRRLAAIYNVPATATEGFGELNLPGDGPRLGFLGHVSFLAANAHAVSSSPTQRGLFIREKLLCHGVPAPPANVNTAIPEPSDQSKSLKERLMVHMEDPSCSPCHAMMDPLGFGLENFDGVGRYRILDNGVPIDPSGDIDGAEFGGPAELAEDIANHPDYAACIVRKLYSYGNGHHVEKGEGELIDWLIASFEGRGRRLLGLFRDIALSDGFRTLGEVQE